MYSPHTAVDATPGGVNDWLADVVAAGSDIALRAAVKPISPAPQGFEGAGYGRLVRFREPVSFAELTRRVGKGISSLTHVSAAAAPAGQSAGITSVAVCAGSGWDVLKDCDAECLVTGEMSHHSALMAKMMGKSVITVFHSNSERGFLRDRLQAQLREELNREGGECVVEVSDKDEDPFVVASCGDSCLATGNTAHRTDSARCQSQSPRTFPPECAAPWPW